LWIYLFERNLCPSTTTCPAPTPSFSSGTTVCSTTFASTRSPCVDLRALRQPDQPETREYRAVHVIADKDVGQASAIATVTVRPR